MSEPVESELLRFYSLGFSWRDAARLAGVDPRVAGRVRARLKRGKSREYFEASVERVSSALWASASPRLKARLEEAAKALGVSSDTLLRMLVLALEVGGDGKAYLNLGGVRVELSVGRGGLAGSLPRPEPPVDVKRRLGELGEALSLCREALAVMGEHQFITALREHGLLSMAKRFLRGEDRSLLEYIKSDDALYMLHALKDRVLSAPDWPEAPEPKPLAWVI